MSPSPNLSISSITPGHEVTEDPPLSVTMRGTVFGLNYDGTNDIGDLDPKQPDGLPESQARARENETKEHISEP